MQSRYLRGLTLSVTLGGAFWILVMLYSIESQTRIRPVSVEDMQEMVRDAVMEVEQVQIHTTSWASGGYTITVSTTQQEGESYEDFTKRHDDAVAERLQQYPKD